MTSSEGSPLRRPFSGEAGTGVRAGYWLLPILRAIPAVAIGLLITFSEDHSARIGLIAFGAFALVTGLVILIGGLTLLRDRVIRGVLVAQGALSVASGALALTLWNGGISILLLIVTMYAALTGVLELYAGLRSRGTPESRDWVGVGALTAVAAIVFVLIPPDPILATGLIGAYAIMAGVFLLIAGFSLKWSTPKPQESDPTPGKVSA